MGQGWGAWFQNKQLRGCPILKGDPFSLSPPSKPLLGVTVSLLPPNNWNCLKMPSKNSAEQVILVREGEGATAELGLGWGGLGGTSWEKVRGPALRPGTVRCEH